MDKPWFKEYEQRFEREIGELEEAGYDVEIDPNARDKGVLRLYLSKNIEGNEIELIAIYPIEFPYFRPQVYSQSIDIKRHKNPINDNLCLLGRSTRYWQPEWTLKQLLEKQLLKTIKQGEITDPQKLKEYPEEQAEPSSAYFDYQQNSYVLIDINEQMPFDDSYGKAIIGIPKHSDLILQGSLLELVDKNNETIYESSILKDRYNHTVECFWANLDHPPYEKSATDVHKLIEDKLEEYRKDQDCKNIDRKVKGGSINRIIAISFPEEISPGKYGVGWLFYVRMKLNKKKRQSRKPYTEYLTRALRVDKENYFKRINSLYPLRQKSVAVVGVGSLGSPCAIELVKAGIKELYLIDPDYFDPSTSVRWALGGEYAGLGKSVSLANYLNKNYLHSDVKPATYGFGKPMYNLDGQDNIGQIDQMYSDLKEVDLIIDTTAEQGVNYYLSRFAKDYGIDYLMGYSTNGYWGGVILSLLKESNGCWFCFQQNMTEGKYPEPPEDTTDYVQPQSCDEPTFIGPHFEIQNFTNILVKKAAGILSNDYTDSYPELDDEVYILSNREENGNIILPNWSSFELTKNKKCPYCN